MFTRLQRDAAHIDMGIRSLNAKMATVMTNYTYRNPDAGPVLDARQASAQELGDEMRRFVADADRLTELVAAAERDGDDIQQELQALATALGMEACMEEAVAEVEDVVAAGGEKATSADAEDEEQAESDEADEETAEEDSSANNGSMARDSPMIVIARSRASMKVGTALETPALARQSRIARPSATSKDRAQPPKQLHF